MSEERNPESLPTGSSNSNPEASPNNLLNKQATETFSNQMEQDNAQGQRLFEQTPRTSMSFASTEPPIRKRVAVEDETRTSLSGLEFNLVVPLITLGETITEKEVIAFRDQARARPMLLTQDVIKGKARTLIGYRIMGDATQQYVDPTESEVWYQHVSISTASEIICRYFGNPRTVNDRPIAEVISLLPFKLNFARQEIEEDTLYTIATTLDKYHESHPTENATTLNELAMIIEKKLPQNSQLLSDYLLKKRSEMGNRQEDTPLKVIKRIKQCMGHVRALRSSVDRYGSYDVTYSAPSKNTLREDNKSPAIRLEQEVYPQCNKCGETSHSPSACPYTGDPDTNKSLAAWVDSAIGERWRNAGYTSYHKGVTLNKGQQAQGHTTSGATDNTNRGPVFDHNDPANILLKAEHRAAKEKKKQNNPQNWGGNNFNQAPGPYNQYGGAYNQPYGPYNGNNNPYNGNNQGGNGKQHKGNNNPGDYGTSTMSTISDEAPHPDFLPTRIFLSQQIMRTTAEAKDHPPLTQAPGDSVTAGTLLDTGALGGNFLSGSMVKRLRGEKFVYQTKCGIVVCSGLDNACYTTNDMIDIGVEFLADNNLTKVIFIKTRISPASKIDLIIGRPTIKKHNFWKWTPSHFSSNTTEENGPTTNPLKRKINNNPSWMPTNTAKSGDILTKPLTQQMETQSQHSPKALGPAASRQTTALTRETPLCACHHRLEVITLEGDNTGEEGHRCPLPPAERLGATTSERVAEICDGFFPVRPPQPTVDAHQIVLATLTESDGIYSRQAMTPDEIDDERVDTFAPFLPDTIPAEDKPHFLDLITFEGDAHLQRDLRALCMEFEHIFRDELGAQPAFIPPFVINVNKSEWETNKNRTPVRPQTAKKETEIAKHIATMVRSGVIVPSQAHYWSHPVIVSKPDGSSRFCIDFRPLNGSSEDGEWPLLKTKETYERIGYNKPVVFGVVDLSSGYHQTPLDLASQVLTAFICFSGVYHFTRVPFGPKRAPSYFQEMMTGVVLFGLVYVMCEMYLDDCIIFAPNNAEFLVRLRAVFSRFSKHNIFLKAKKCKFGMAQVEYVGKIISKSGLTMSEKKITQVLDFPRPVNNTQLRSFLGLANYFRDFVPNHSNVVNPLHKMVDNSATKRTPITWTPEGTTAFEEVKGLISRCPLLYFVNDTAPITLRTDASQYGVGGCLSQLVDDVEQPIAFISKSLTEIQLRWSTIQKEAYAIFFCCTKLDTLLRDRKFTIMTDHANLTFLNNDSNPMVVRWSIALQELTYKIKFIPGVENTVADALSRLCPNLTLPQPHGTQTVTTETLSAITEMEPLSDRERTAIISCHNERAGHGGVERTIRLLLLKNHRWPYMRQAVREFIRECPCCQKMSAIKIAIHTTPFVTSSYDAMEVINIDFVGPFPDKKYILVMIDTFTRWTELYHCIDATAKAAAESLLQHFGRFGCPRAIRSDRGPHFANETIEQFLQMTGVGHNLTLAYSSQENAKVERVNKEVNRHLRAFVFETCSIDEYQRGIPFVQRIINSAPNHKTGITPAQLLFGNMIDLDRSIITPYPERQNHNIPTQQLLAQMLATQDRLTRMTREIQQKEDQIHLNSNSEPITHFEVGSFVLVQRREGLPSRLHTKWLGPMKILEHKNSEYRLLNLITTKEKTYHAQHMKEFIFNPLYVDPADVARRDYLEYFVEQIEEHRGNPKRLATMEFLVKWTAYDTQHNSWEPYSNLRKTTQLHDYLRANNLLSLIPQEFRVNRRGADV